MLHKVGGRGWSQDGMVVGWLWVSVCRKVRRAISCLIEIGRAVGDFFRWGSCRMADFFIGSDLLIGLSHLVRFFSFMTGFGDWVTW